MRRRAAVGACCLLLVAAAALGSASSGCSRDSTNRHGRGSNDVVGGILGNLNIGEKVFTIYRARHERAPARAAEQVAALDARRDDFINAVNATLTADSLQNIGPPLKAFFALVDDGTLPAMAENVAQVLELALNEPGRKALAALVALENGTRTVLQTDDVLELAARMMNYAEIEELLLAISELVRLNDGLMDDLVTPDPAEQDIEREVLAFLSRALEDAGQAPPAGAASATGLLAGIGDEMLAIAPLRGGSAFYGPASWAVRVDRNGNPAVMIDPASGTVYAPFTDADLDRVADVDGDLWPVDATGQRIDIPAFSRTSGVRDGEGRALVPSGGGSLLSDSFDAKQTLLAHFRRLGGDAIRVGLLDRSSEVIEMVLGARYPNDSGTPADPSDDFLGFDPWNPLPDLAYGGLELFKYEHSPRLLRALADLMENNPRLAEDLLVAVGRVIEKLRPLAFQQMPTAASRQLQDELRSIADQIFEIPSAGSVSTGRAIMDVVHAIGRSARELPGELALMIRYRTLVVGANGLPDLGSSILVDFAQPPGQTNRRVLHQLLDLVAEADGCRTFVFFGGSLAEDLIDLMAGFDPATVANLIPLLDQAKVILAFTCPGVLPDLDGLKGLAASGALDAFLPIAKEFSDRGETRLLVDILKTLEARYLDVMRPQEPEIADILESGAVERLFDVLDLMTQFRDPATGMLVADIVADSLGDVTDDDRAVYDRSGARVRSLAHLLLEPLRRAEDRVRAAGGPGALTSLLYAATDLLVERVTNDNGTPQDPSDDYEQLLNPSLVPFFARTLRHVAANLPPDPNDRARYMSDLQTEAVEGLLGPDFAAVVDLLAALTRAPGKDRIHVALIHLLTPNPSLADDVFGSVLRIVACGLQARVQDPQAMRDLAAFAGQVIDPARQHLVNLLYGLNKVLLADQGRFVLTALRNYLNVAPPEAGLPPGLSPAQVIASIQDEIATAARAPGANGHPAPATLQEMVDSVQGLVTFIRDSQDGLQSIFDFIRNRKQ